MSQLTIRLDEQLAGLVKSKAHSAGRSVNGWVVAVLSAAVDPDLAGSDAERTRERLARAGLLAASVGVRPTRPDPERIERARRAAGSGMPLSDLVSEGRG